MAELGAHELQVSVVSADSEIWSGTAKQVVAHVYTDVDQKLWPAAEKSTQAQLDYLRQ